MLFGQTTDGTEVYSPWFPRQGDNARFTLEVVAVSSATLKVEVFTKNSEDAGDGTIVSGVSATSTTVERKVFEAEGGLEELVRYKFTVTDAVTKWVLFRMLRPVWFDSVEAA